MGVLYDAVKRLESERPKETGKDQQKEREPNDGFKLI